MTIHENQITKFISRDIDDKLNYILLYPKKYRNKTPIRIHEP
jgi:hypothetical protein